MHTTPTRNRPLLCVGAGLLSILLLIASCKTVNVRVAAHSTVDSIEGSIHRQFYEAFQNLALEDGITVIPQNLQVKFDHTTTKSASGGFTVFSIFQSNFSYQRQLDNSVTDILTPTKISSSSGLTGFTRGNNSGVKTCVFSPDTLKPKDEESVTNLTDLIQKSAKAFSDVPNLGTLNDHQITLDIKFSIQTDGNIIVSPTWVLGPFAKINLKVDKTSASTDEISFTYDVVKNPGVPFMSNLKYYHMKDSVVKKLPNVLCDYFPIDDYLDSTSVDTLVTPPAIDQHGYSACVAYAIGYTALSTMLKKSPGPTFTTKEVYSPDFIFARMTDNKCTGLDLPSALNFVVLNGDCTLEDFPLRDTMACGKYTAVNDTIKHAIPKAAVIAPMFSNKWIPLDPNNINQIRACINNKEPVIVGFYISSSFVDMWNYGNPSYDGQNVWSTLMGPYYDAHAVCIVGYDNNKRLFKVQNSWGMKNASKGFFYVTYDLVQRGCFSQAYCFIPKI